MAASSRMPSSLSELEAARERLLTELDDIDQEIERMESAELNQIILEGEPSSRAESFDPNFGYLSRSAGNYVDTEAALDGVSGVPSGFVDIASRNFLRELPEATDALKVALRPLLGHEESGAERIGRLRKQLRLGTMSMDVSKRAPICAAASYRSALRRLSLSNTAIWAREKHRRSVDAPWLLLAPYYLLCFALDTFFDGRPIARFWFLETVARMPYFSYISLLHLYESLGWWRRSAETKRVHFAEEWNEFHHLLIMESLGGDQLWIDRFLGHHAAIMYFWILVGMWLLSPSLSYNFSELIEAHAVDTYAEFVDANAEALRKLPAPRVARLYYGGDDLYLFDEFQTSRRRGSRYDRTGALVPHWATPLCRRGYQMLNACTPLSVGAMLSPVCSQARARGDLVRCLQCDP